MPVTKIRFEPTGVIPACLMPFSADLAIDEKAYRAHLDDIASVPGLSAIATNGHAAEVHTLTSDEQRRIVAITTDQLAGRLPTIAGVFTNSSREAQRLARAAEAEGAAGLLVFPPDLMTLGGHLRPEMIYSHLARIADASGLPIVLFEYPLLSNLSYPLETLLELCRQVPTIVAVKDQVGDGALHERHIRELHALSRPVKLLTTHSSWLLGSLALGCDGLLSGAGSVIADLQLALFRAIQSGDLKGAQAINDRIYPTVRAFYDPPLVDMHNRMKEALVLLGRIPCAAVRPPLVAVDTAEIERLRVALVQAQVARDGARLEAA
ncbi:MAG: dihydrodipicolinate synthase family protein [Stellaceae bacterium]